jgi:GNAT superfamily N-acetyltransferase
MSDILRNPNTSELIYAIEHNIYEWAKAIQNLEHIEYEEKDEFAKYYSGIPFPMANGVINTNIPSETAEQTIDEIVSFFEERKMPFVWYTGPSSQPHNLKELLINNKLISVGKEPGMAYNLNSLALDTKPIPNLKIVEVGNIEAAKLWADVCFTVAEWPKELMLDLMVNIIISTCLNDNSPHKAFIGYYNDIPIATSYVFFGAGVAGIYNVCTLEEARNKGIGTAMSVKCLQQANEIGYEVAILQSSEMGINVYNNIGFKEYCRLEVFMWSPE